MESGLRKIDLVICICTELYVSKANAGTGGVGTKKKRFAFVGKSDFYNNGCFSIGSGSMRFEGFL